MVEELYPTSGSRRDHRKEFGGNYMLKRHYGGLRQHTT